MTILARKRESKEDYRYKGIRYSYDQDRPETQEPEFELHFEVPEGMSVPENKKILALIERTAKFVNNSSEPTMEIILQAKQATNPSFAFMSRRHRLFQFYKHVRYLMQTGLYEYEEEVRQREEDEAKAEQEARYAAMTSTIKDALHVDIQRVIEETADFIAHNSDAVFFEKLMCMNDPRFAFLDSAHVWHGFYQWKLEECQLALSKTVDPYTNGSISEAKTHVHDNNDDNDDNGGGDAVETLERDGSGIAVAVAVVVDEQQPRTSKSEEIIRQERLQRIREMFKQKQKKEELTENAKKDDSPMKVATRRFSNSSPISASRCSSRLSSRGEPRSRSRSTSRSTSRSRSSSRSRSRSSSRSRSRSKSQLRSRSSSRSRSRSISPNGHSSKRLRMQ